MKGSDTETQSSIAPLFTGYRSNIVGQKFTYAPNQHLALNAGLDYSYKITSRPETRADITGGTDYEMRYKGLRWNVGGIYKFTSRNSIQANFVVDRVPTGDRIISQPLLVTSMRRPIPSQPTPSTR